MGIKLLLSTLFISITLLASSQTEPNHVLIKFKENTSDSDIATSVSKVLRVRPYDNSYRMPRPDVVILPIEVGYFQMIASQLKAIENVDYVAPAFRNEKGQFFTFTDELFVKVKDDNSLTDLKRIAVSNKATFVGETNFLNDVYRLKVSKNSSHNAHDLAKLLTASGEFEYAEANYLFTPTVPAVDPPNDPVFNRQWNMLNTGATVQYHGTPGADMNVLDAWDTTMGSADIKVAILDSGVDTLHEDLVDNLLGGYDAVGEGKKGYPNTTYDNDGHGTCCAGIVAAVANNGIGIAGVAPKCKIIPVRVFYYLMLGSSGDPQPWSTSEWFADGIKWAWETGGADVASNSWGVPDYILDFIDPNREGMALVNDVLEEAITTGRGGLGTPYLFSSGNEGTTDTIPIWPARADITIAVNAMSMCDEAKTDTSCDNEGWWAGNWGNHLDISAPGVKIPATDMTGGNGYKPGEYYNTFNGTSSACPNAAGVMALILSTYPELTSEKARWIISSTCDKVGGYDYDQDKTYGTWSYELGYGKVNAHAAVVLASEEKNKPIDIVSQAAYTWSDDASGANYIHLFLEEDSGVVELEVYDIMGNLVKSFNQATLPQGEANILINSNDLKSGLYIIRANIDGRN